MSEKAPYVLLSSGGTGGHMSPASALASDLVSRGFRVELVTDRRGVRYEAMFRGIRTHVVQSGAWRSGVYGKIRGVIAQGVGFFQAWRLIRSARPDLVVGFGGYPSVPAVYAAQRSHIPTIVHEQNAIIGRANAFLMEKAERIALSLAETRGLDRSEQNRAVVTGNPVRPEIAELYNKPYSPLIDQGNFRIFIVGGSLGASVFAEVIPVTLARLSEEYRSRLRIFQQCRADDINAIKKVYDDAGIQAVLTPFFDDVAEQLSKAQLVISRSGASTVAEVTAAGRPVIFVPYPHHKDQQQKMNADAVADGGGAWVMTEEGFTQEALLARIETFLQNPEILFRAAECSRAFGKPDAARRLGNLVTAIVSGWS